MPDRLLRAKLAQAAAGEAAAHREGEGAPFSVGQRWKADHQPDGGAGVRAGDEAGEKRAFQGQVGRIVVQQQARDDPRRERDPEAEGEDEPIRPVAALENQDVPEPPVAHEHRRQRRHDRQLHDERREQDLLAGEDRRLLHGFTLILSAG